ncbi:hypothetical protein MRX96_011293 [Rhipicephalus microplus]
MDVQVVLARGQHLHAPAHARRFLVRLVHRQLPGPTVVTRRTQGFASRRRRRLRRRRRRRPTKHRDDVFSSMSRTCLSSRSSSPSHKPAVVTGDGRPHRNALGQTRRRHGDGNP